MSEHDPHDEDALLPGGLEGTDSEEADSEETGSEEAGRDETDPDAREYAAPGRRRAKPKSRVPGCLAVLVALAVIAGGLYFVASWGVDALRDQFAGAEDFSGPGTGSVTFEVEEGDTIAQMGRNLKEAGVIASVDAFTQAAAGNPDATRIQVGFYELRKEMAAADALEVLVDPANLVKNSLTIPEGLRVVDIVDRLVEHTGFGKQRFLKVLDNPDQLGLPDYAEGNPEGYLFPATYDFGPKAKPQDMLKAMVDRWRQAAEAADLEAAAADLGYTPQELMTIASLVQAEGRGEDMAKVARVIYNRLEIEPNPSAGFLQVDASVNYALDKPTVARLTTAEIDSVADSPYNTYKQKGLPPTPIEAPGDDAIAAAANPADGPWFFYVTVNLRTGETKFTDSYDEFLSFKREFDEYCATESDRC